MDWRNTIYRSARTFIQAALSYIVTALGAGLAGFFDAEGNISKVAVCGLITSALAAGLAALMNLPEKKADVEIVAPPYVAKKYVESIDDLPLAGQEIEEAEAETDENGESEGVYGETV